MSPTGQAEAAGVVLLGLCETWGQEEPAEWTSSDPAGGRGDSLAVAVKI